MIRISRKRLTPAPGPCRIALLCLGLAWVGTWLSPSASWGDGPAAAMTAPAAVTQQGPDYLLQGTAYSATVDGATGMLKNLSIDGVVAVESTSIDLDKRPFTKIAVSQESPTKVTAIISSVDNNTPADNALRLSYEALPDSLVIRTYATVGRVSGRGLVFNIGHEAQMVRSLDFKETVPVPVGQYRSPWMRVKYYFSNGATLGIINEGAGNPFNANENGSVSAYKYSRGGYVANSEYVYTLIPQKADPKPAGKVLGSPAIAIAEANTPAVFWQGDPVQISLSLAKSDYQKLAGLTGLQLKYEVDDAFENTVAQGSSPLDLSSGADPIVIKLPLKVTKLGWYRASVWVEDANNSLLQGQERLFFSVLKHQPDMGEDFTNQIHTDYTLGLGLTRVGINNLPIDQVSTTSDQMVSESAGTDVNVTYQIDGPPAGVGNDPAKFGQYCANLFTKTQDKIGRVEIINEPNGTLEPKAYVDTFLRPAYTNIKQVSPNTKVLGPVLCGIGPDQARYLSELYQLGLKDITDELTFHPYAGNFDDGGAVAWMKGIQTVIAANGDQAKPIHFTEAGYGHGGWSDLAGMREVIKYVVSQYAWQNAVMGIDYRHNFYYFTDQMGYLDFWLRSNQLTPAAVAMRTYTGLTKNQGRAQLLDFGSLEDVRAFLYPARADAPMVPGDPAKQVVALWTSSNNDSVTATDVSFTTDAKSVDWLDCFGNPLPAKVVKGGLTLSVPTFPTYLVLPPGAKIAPVKEEWGTNVALASLGSVAEATSEQGTQPAISAIDGDTSTASCWRSLTPNDLPQSLTVTLAGPATIDRAGIWSFSARGYDLEAMGPDGQWKLLVSRRDQPFKRFRDETFAPITTDQVRFTVVDSFSSYAECAELQLFSPNSRAQSVDLVNWAAAENGGTAKASSEMVKDIAVAEQDWGAKKPRIVQTHVDAGPANAIDGKRLISGWREFYPTTWIAAPGSTLPQWLEVDLAGTKTINTVAVYTIAFGPWTPANSGIRDWQVQVPDGAGWKTVDTVTGNERVSKISRFKTPLTADKIRILVTATNDPEGTVGIMEVEAYGPAH